MIERKAYIGDFAVVTETGLAGSTTIATSYLQRDHLGSIDVITDEAGSVLEQMSFDAWGKRRNIDWTPMVSTTAYITTLTTRGFTGHEQLDSVGLVHMNGRVYDPELGRFLSADPFVQDVTNLQSWNRYTYVLNNPLSMTDPTGFFFGKIFKAIGKFFKSVFKAIGSVFKAVLSVPILKSLIQIVGCAPPHGWITCAPTVMALTLAAGGSLADAFKAAAFSVASMGVFHAVGVIVETAHVLVQSAVHGVVSGALSVAQGGKFLTGFLSGAVGKFAGTQFGTESGFDMFTSTALVGAAGGLTAELTGGKFHNGFVTAAFANMYNEWKGGRASKYVNRGQPIDPEYADVTALDAVLKVAGIASIPVTGIGGYAARGALVYYGSRFLGAIRDTLLRAGRWLHWKSGREIVLRPNRINLKRIAPLGNRTGHPIGRFFHYHRSRPDPKRPGHSLPGQSAKRHRPFEKKPEDKSFLDRF